MMIIECLLFLIGVLVGTYGTVRDLRYGKVPNKLLWMALIPVAVLNVLYYGMFATGEAWIFGVNMAVIIAVSLLFYATHIWGGGDSKLLILLAMTIPTGSYFYVAEETLPLLSMVILIFSLGYVYLIIHSLVCAVRGEQSLRTKIDRTYIRDFCKNYIIGSVYLTFVMHMVSRFLGDFYIQNQMLFLFVNVFISMLIFSCSIFKNIWLVAVCAVADVVLAISSHTLLVSGQLWAYLIMVVLIVLRELMSGFNYQKIAIADLKPGMILSAASIVLMLPSGIEGLPADTSEDLRGRLTGEHIEAIHKWQKRRKKYQELTIVRKIPFAAFIALGYLVFVLMGGIR